MEIISSQPLFAALPPSAMAYPAQILPMMENLIFKSRKGRPFPVHQESPFALAFGKVHSLTDRMIHPSFPEALPAEVPPQCRGWSPEE